jgi:hypothetical protein
MIGEDRFLHGMAAGSGSLKATLSHATLDLQFKVTQ